MNEKQTNYLFISLGVFIVLGSIYSANAKPNVSPELTDLLERTRPTELDYRFVSCYLYLTSHGSPKNKETADYCRRVNLGGWVLDK